MPDLDEIIVREFFELNGFLVRQLGKHETSSKKKHWEETVDLIVENPDAHQNEPIVGFQLFAHGLKSLQKALIVIRGWQSPKANPATLKSNPKTLAFIKKDAGGKDEYYFDFDTNETNELASFLKILVIPSLPKTEPHRQECIDILKQKGVDGIITVRTLLDNIIQKVEINRDYKKSEVLQLIKTLKIYDLIKDPQMDLFSK